MEKTCILYGLEGDVQRLHDLARRRGWAITQTLTDNPATAPGQGPGWDALCRVAAKGTGQVIIVPSLAVLGAGLDDFVGFAGKLVSANIDLVVVDGSIDSTTKQGTAWLAAVASLTGYQQALRRQKARAGQLRAKAAGVKFGRKPIPESTIEMVRAALLRNEGTRITARRYRISASRVAMEKKAVNADRGPAQ